MIANFFVDLYGRDAINDQTKDSLKVGFISEQWTNESDEAAGLTTIANSPKPWLVVMLNVLTNLKPSVDSVDKKKSGNVNPWLHVTFPKYQIQPSYSSISKSVYPVLEFIYVLKIIIATICVTFALLITVKSIQELLKNKVHLKYELYRFKIRVSHYCWNQKLP